MLDVEEKYRDVVDQLSSRQKVVYELPPSHPDRIKVALAEAGIPLRAETLDVDAYQRWREKIDYERNYPKYVAEFPEGPLLFKKSLEHYVSIVLSPPEPHHTYMDVASSNSVIPDILETHYGLSRIYRQDIRYPEGVHGWQVGCNAAAIPLPEHSIDRAALHCSIEHFEESADTHFIQEAARLLKPGGQVCVTPLYLAEEYYIMTSRLAWEKQGIPELDPNATVCIGDKYKLKYSKHFDVPELRRQILQPAEEAGLEWEIVHFENWRDLPRIPVFTLLVSKPAD